MQEHNFPAGWKVFPLHPGTKKPIFDGWPALATEDVVQIAQWADDYPGCNWAVAAGPSGLSMIDLDGGEIGEASLFQFELDEGFLPETREHRSARGGRHMIYRGDIQNSASKLGPKIDTRGGNGYIVIPPSTFEGKPYELIQDRPIADLPDFVRAAAGKHRDAVGAAEGASLDDDRQISRGRRLLHDYVERGHVAREGEGGDNRTYEVAAEVLNLGLTEAKALELILDIWNPACVPPWAPDELATKVSNAAAYSQNEAGAWAVSPTSDRISKTALDKLLEDADATSVADVGERAGRFAWMDEDQFTNMPPPEFIIGEMLVRRSVAVLYGKSGHYKSFIALNLGAQVAQHGECAFYVAGEGINRMARNDYPAWKLAHGEDKRLPFYLVEDMPDATSGEDYARFAASIKAKAAGRPVGIVFLDTFNRAMSGLEENSAKDVGMFIKLADELRKFLNCTVVLVHHTGDGPQDKMRGSSAIFGGVDTVLRLEADKAVKVARLWVQKQKNAPERERPWCFEGKKFGPGLAFVEIDQKVAGLMASESDIYSPKNIGAVLARLGAVGEDAGISSHILAGELIERLENDTDDQWNDTITKVSKGLAGAAKGRADAYAYGEGKKLRWYLPEALPVAV